MTTYVRFELVRTFRNRRFVLFALAFPLLLYFAVAGPNRHEHDLGKTGISAPLYFMVSLLTFGAMNAVLSAAGRISAERTAGWNRQLRLTPLTPRAYFRTKVLTGYALAAATIVALYASGSALGVRLSTGEWAGMTGLILVGLIPFAALAILLGHLVSSDAIGPVLGGTTALLALLGGVWFPVGTHGLMHAIAQALPSYWLVQAARVGAGGTGWGTTGWLVVAAWSIAATALASRAYRRDTARV